MNGSAEPPPLPGPLAPEQDLPLLQVLEGLGDGVWDWNLVTGEEYFSPRLLAIYGYGAGDGLILAGDLDALTHPEDLPRMQTDREAHWAGRVPTYRNEHRVRARDGRWIWVLTRGVVVARDAQGRPLRMVGTHTDITERKVAELVLRTTQERLELATRGSNDGLWDWDLRTDRVYYSPRFRELLGYASETGFESHFSFRSQLHPEDMERVTAQVREHLRGQSVVFDSEYRLRSADGTYRWFHGRGRAAWGTDGQAQRFAGHITDITERVQAQTAQRELEVQLRDAQKLEALGTLTGGVAQDFNNLLSVVLGNLQLAQRELQGQHAARASLSEALKAAERARTLVQQLLLFSRKHVQHMAVFDLAGLVADALAQVRATLPQGVRLSSALPPQPLRVLVDASQIQLVVMNLCANAVQALAGPGGELRVYLGAAGDGLGASLVVQDDGPGMDPQVLQRVFDPFFTTQSVGRGSGLGLSVVHGVVKAHQGRVTASSLPGQGARFEVWLPLVAPQAQAEPLPEPVQPPSVVAARGLPAETEGRHVVYIDDYEAMVYLVRRMLQKHGHRVSAFERAEDALALLRHTPGGVDLLVTDYNMPGLSGVDVILQARALQPGLPVVITSGHVTAGMLAEAEGLDVLRVLSKEDSVEDLARALAGLLADLPVRTPQP